MSTNKSNVSKAHLQHDVWVGYRLQALTGTKFTRVVNKILRGENQLFTRWQLAKRIADR